MVVLKFVLYLICFISLSWGAIIVAGPTIIKSLVSSYSKGQITAISVSVTPKLDIKIDRLDYSFASAGDQEYRKGFSRSVKVLWSIFGDKPFIELKSGATIVDGFFFAKKLDISTPSFSEVNFQNVVFKADANNIELQAGIDIKDLSLQGVYKPENLLVGEVSVVSPEIVLSSSQSGLLEGLSMKVSEFDLAKAIDEQPIFVELLVSKAMSEQSQIIFSNVNGALNLGQSEIGFRLSSTDFELMELGKLFTKISLEGRYAKNGLLKTAFLEATSESQTDTVGQQYIFMDISSLDYGRYGLQVRGALRPFDLNFSDTYAGKLPASNFEISMAVDGSNSSIDARSRINFEDVGIPEINGKGRLSGKLKGSENLFNCLHKNCRLEVFTSNYNFSAGKEWVSGASSCEFNQCNSGSFSHTFRTSDTNALFNIINQSKILNPLYSLYLFNAVNAGAKLGSGHEVKIN